MQFFNGHVLHSNIFSGSNDLLGQLNLVRVLFSPSGVAAFQGVNLGHVVAQSGQDIGGSLSVTLAGVADDDQVVIGGLSQSLHSSNACSEVAFLCSIHVDADGTGDGGSLVVGSLTDVDKGVALSVQQLVSFLNSDVLHCNVSSGSGDSGNSFSLGSLSAASAQQAQQHHCNQQDRDNSLHSILQ